MNCVIMGWVNLAMANILQVLFGIPKDIVLWYVMGALVLTALYSATSGLWGVAVTDVFQFIIAMAGTIILAIVVIHLPQVGGISGLREKLPASAFQFLPSIGGTTGLGIASAFALSVSAFLAYIAIQWWAAWYPGAEPGGGGYVAQRMMSSKDEKHSLLATLWFTVAHYCVRPWPWILTGLATLVLYPQLGPEDKKLGYILAMRDYLPAGLLGFLVSAFFAAYMSTIATQLNWGTSYIINDFYKRFVKREGTEHHYVLISRITTLVVMAISVIVTANMQTISGAWSFVIEAGAGLGLVLILRWYWWRVNAWSEITAMTAPFLGFGFVRYATDIQFPESLFVIVAFTTVCWLTVTFLTRPTDESRLLSFYERVHPGGVLWKPIADKLPGVRGDSGFAWLFLDWIAGVVLVYSTLFGTGKLLLGESGSGFFYYLVAFVSAFIIFKDLSRRGWARVAE
jgi:SSS family solute:Na+ symporter